MSSASTSNTTQLFTDALQLAPPQREELAMLLLDSLPDDVSDTPVVVDEALEQEIERRLAERAAGTARVVDLATFTATVQAAAKAPSAT
jgi:putative addiction module component (TIGR02574 family)